MNTRQAWEKVQPYGPDADTTYWVRGIYKVVSYRPGNYHAYFIPEGIANWGDYVTRPPDKSARDGYPCWRTLRAAKSACSLHARSYAPSSKTQARAREVLAAYQAKALEHAA